ncbi:hypothetical protein EGW08_018384, partial [Elysia chlorotica]
MDATSKSRNSSRDSRMIGPEPVGDLGGKTETNNNKDAILEDEILRTTRSQKKPNCRMPGVETEANHTMDGISEEEIVPVTRSQRTTTFRVPGENIQANNRNSKGDNSEEEIVPTTRSHRQPTLHMPDESQVKLPSSTQDSDIGLAVEEAFIDKETKARVTPTHLRPSSGQRSLDSRPSASPVSAGTSLSGTDGRSADIKPRDDVLSHKYGDTTDSTAADGNEARTTTHTDGLNNNDKHAVNNNNKATRNVSLEKGASKVETLNEENKTNDWASRDKPNTSSMNDLVTSSTTLTLAPPTQNIPSRNPPAVSTVKSVKPNTRAVSKRTFDVNKDEDGSVTYQASSEEPGQNRTVTVRTRRLRTPSDATEELKDTIVERKYRVQRPAAKSGNTDQQREALSGDRTCGRENQEGTVTRQTASSDPFSDVLIEERDVVRTKTRLTSRGSNYFSRSAVTTRLRRDRHGTARTVEHDVVVESGAKSVSTGKSWGNRAETHVTNLGDDEDDGLEISTTQPSTDTADREREKDVANSAEFGTEQVAEVTTQDTGSLSASSPEVQDDSANQRPMMGVPGVKVGMDLSKVSSGYGSGPGSEEESGVTRPGQGDSPSSEHAQGPPEVVQVLKDVTICEGRQLCLECAFSGSQLDGVVWFKDGVEISTEEADAATRYDSDTGKAAFSVSRATIFDTALYACAARNEAGEAKTSCRVVVKRRPVKPPAFESGLTHVTVTEGHSTVMTCILSDAESVAWYKDGIVQRNSSDFKQTFDGRSARLEIGEVFLDDVGEYACVAKNDAGESRSSCRLDVRACGSETTVVPMFLTKMSSKVVNSGDTLRLECDVIGTPEPSITWTKDNEDLSPQLSFSTCYDGRLATLELSGMRMEDAGTYRCIACNPAGRVSMDAQVTVQVKNQAPFFASTPEDVTTQAGHSVMFKCEVRGVPRPLVFWRLNGQPVGDSARCIQSYTGGVARLELLGSAHSDGGVYDCVARNDVGEAVCSCSLLVLERTGAREEQVSNAPPAAITVRRRTFKKLSEPRPADIISAVLQRAATSPRVQRAQSFSPQSTSGRSPPVASSPPALSDSSSPRHVDTGRSPDTTTTTTTGAGGDGSTHAPDQLPDLPECSAPVLGKASSLERDINGKYFTSKAEHPSVVSSGNKENSGGSSTDSDSSEKLSMGGDSLRSARPGELPDATARLGDLDSSGEFHRQPRQTNLGRSASMHTVRNNNFRSARESTQSPLVTAKAVWAPGERTPGGVTPREVTSGSASSLEKLSEVSSPGEISGYRSVSPMLSRKSENKQISSESGGVAANAPSTSHSSQHQPLTTSAVTTSELSVPSKTPPQSVSTDQTILNDKTISLSASDGVSLPTSSVNIENPSQPSPPSVPSSSSSSSSSSPLASSRLSLQSSARDTHSDLEPPTQSTGTSQQDQQQQHHHHQQQQHQQQQQQQQELPQAAPTKAGKTMSPRVSELRLQFLKKDEEAARGTQRPAGGGGVRRWHSLPPQEFKPKVIKRDVPTEPRPAATMPGSYESITDEEELHKMMNATEDFGERKAIRARLREIRDKQREEMEAKRREREARAEDHVKKKFLQAEEQKRKTMEAYKNVAPTHERESKYHTFTESMIQEKQKLADADKAAKMASYSTTKTSVGPGGETITTSIVTEKTPVGTVSRKVVEKTGPGAAPGGARPAEETARELTEQLLRSSGPGVRGQMTVKTESWSSADGQVRRSENTHTWGG